MNREIPIVIDPSLDVDVATLKAAWERDPKARELGTVEARASRQFTGVLELVVIPIVVSVASALIVEAIKRLLPAEKKETVVVVVHQLADGQEAIMVQKQ